MNSPRRWLLQASRSYVQPRPAMVGVLQEHPGVVPVHEVVPDDGEKGQECRGADEQGQEGLARPPGGVCSEGGRTSSREEVTNPSARPEASRVLALPPRAQLGDAVSTRVVPPRRARARSTAPRQRSLPGSRKYSWVRRSSSIGRAWARSCRGYGPQSLLHPRAVGLRGEPEHVPPRPDYGFHPLRIEKNRLVECHDHGQSHRVAAYVSCSYTALKLRQASRP